MNKTVISVASFIVVFIAAAYFIPWQSVKWGKLELLPASTITVTGEAKSETKSQVATFTAGVYSVSDNKDTAVEEVNTKVAAVIKAVKDFGIQEADIKTQNLSIYQMEESINVEGRQRSAPGQWRVSNDISVKLREVDQAAALADLLAESGANNVYGPNFSLDDTGEAEVALLETAIDNARTKAQAIAAGSDKKLGDILNVQEGVVSAQPIFYAARMEGGGGGGAPVEPGSQTVQKTVTVTFELK